MLKRIAIIIFLGLLFLTRSDEGVCAENKPSVKIGILALRGKEHCLQNWTPTATYLSTAIPGETFSIVPLDYNDAVSDLQKKYRHLILAFFSAFIILGLITIFVFLLYQRLKLANKKLKQSLSECKVIENELKKSEAKYRSLFEATPDAIVIGNKNGAIDCNGAALKLFGFSSKEELTNRSAAQSSPIKQLDDRDSQESYVGYIQEALTKGSTFFEWVFKRKDGSTFPAEVMLSRLEVEGGDVVQALVRDVTSRKQIETERECLINDFQETLSQVKTLKGLLPICANCKKVRDDKGYWNQIENYVQQHTDASFTHGLCPECAKQLYPDLYAERKKRKEKTWEFD